MIVDRWFLAIAAYLLGLLTGWLIWSGGKAASFEDGAAETSDSLEGDGAADVKQEPSLSAGNDKKPNGNDAPDTLKLGALQAELEKAKTLLADSEQENAALTDLLSNIDDAVKRANGRLKLILKSVKRAKD